MVIPGNPFSGTYYSRGSIPVEGTSLGNVLRTTLLDESGSSWNLLASGLTGMSVVSVGKRTTFVVYSPSEIVSVLLRRDQLGTDMTRDNNQTEPFAFVFGSTTTIAPGESANVTMSFLQDAPMEQAAGLLPKVFHFNSEIVVGTAEKNKRSYALYNLSLDQIRIP
jgi:hypothetical protein